MRSGSHLRIRVPIDDSAIEDVSSASLSGVPERLIIKHLVNVHQAQRQQKHVLSFGGGGNVI
jgi:hypothetical protein